jgi:2-polyprenyl-6-hydroxyphenyl methylase/3-demethylubiquinone-9 3-methyltransferase
MANSAQADRGGAADQTRSGTVDPAEVARFERLAREWWNPNGKMKPLHKFNPVRLGYLRDTIGDHFGRDRFGLTPFEGLSLIDIGCGGGLLSEPMARLGAAVTGLDPAAGNVEVAKIHAAQSGLAITYRADTAQTLVAEGQSFDVVLAMEVVEHVPDVADFTIACGALVKPGGLLIMATLNRTLRSFALAIVGAEYVLRWLPVGTHSWDKFVTPEELARAMTKGGCAVIDRQGVVYNPLTDQWSLARDMAVNYMMTAEKAG